MSATDELFRNTCVIDYDVVARASMKILCLCLFLAKNTPPQEIKLLEDLGSDLNKNTPPPPTWGLQFWTQPGIPTPHTHTLGDFSFELNQEYPPHPSNWDFSWRTWGTSVWAQPRITPKHLKLGLFMQDFGTSVLSLPRMPPPKKNLNLPYRYCFVKHFLLNVRSIGRSWGSFHWEILRGHLRAEISLLTKLSWPKVGSRYQ